MSVPTPRNFVTPTDDGALRSPRESTATTSVICARATELASRAGRLEIAVASACGTRHDVNEDAHSALDGGAPLFVVADGVGGGALAARASRELVARLHGQLDRAAPDADSVRAALLDADQEIARSIAIRTQASGAATVALCVASDASLAHWLLAWVGDCRIYRVPGDATQAAQLLTIDDTYENLHETPPAGGSSDDPARMVGNGAVDAPNVRTIELRHRELLVLCSDGVHKHASAGEIADTLREAGALARNAARLIELARSHGSHDDATVLVVRRMRPHLTSVARVVALTVIAAVMTGALAWMAGELTSEAPPPQQLVARPTSPSGAQP